MHAYYAPVAQGGDGPLHSRLGRRMLFVLEPSVYASLVAWLPS